MPMICATRFHSWKSASLLLFLLPGFATSVMAQSAGPSGPSPYGRLIREIRIEGLRITQESIVRDQLTSQVGQVYTEQTAQEDHRWLDRLGIFSSI